MMLKHLQRPSSSSCSATTAFLHSISQQNHHAKKKQARGFKKLLGGASPQATEDFCKHRFPLPDGAVGRGGKCLQKSKWTVSPIGFGGYRVSDERTHQFALQYAVQAGANVIDTSTNYTNGESETMIGTVISGMVETDIIKRQEIILMSKVGYIQEDNLNHAKKLEAEEKPYPGVVKLENDHWHSISPEFIEDQLSESLDRLNVEKIDVLFLHNPEYCWEKSESPEQMYAKIEKAFEQLEREVDKGRIQKYGISSNTFSLNPAEHGNLSIEKCLKIAEKVKKNHNFEFVQMPLNINESEAVTAKFYSNGTESPIEYAKRNGLCTIGNRPLNAIIDGKLCRFVDGDNTSRDRDEILKNLNNAMQIALATEFKFPEPERFSDMPNGDKRYPPRTLLSWAQVLSHNMDAIDSLYTFKDLEKMHFMPGLHEGLEKLRQLKDSKRFAEWITAYRFGLAEFFRAFEEFLKYKQNVEANKQSEKMISIAGELADSKTLPQKVVRVLCSSGVDTVLVGMRKQAHVEDILIGLGSGISKEKAIRMMNEAKWQEIQKRVEYTDKV